MSVGFLALVVKLVDVTAASSGLLVVSELGKVDVEEESGLTADFAPVLSTETSAEVTLAEVKDTAPVLKGAPVLLGGEEVSEDEPNSDDRSVPFDRATSHSPASTTKMAVTPPTA